MLESHINKVTGLYTAILLKERNPTRCFLQEKYFINKRVKNPLREGEKIEATCKKNNHTDKART